LISSAAYKRKDYKKALEDTFLKMDKLLLSDKGKKELRLYMEADDGQAGYSDYL
jgi:hypothetical protein